ncbi:MAG: hypothetical protein ACD_51C00012G0001, partial [uncultured bacterium]
MSKVSSELTVTTGTETTFSYLNKFASPMSA